MLLLHGVVLQHTGFLLRAEAGMVGRCVNIRYPSLLVCIICHSDELDHD